MIKSSDLQEAEQLFQNPSDDVLRPLLQSAKTIAVVGLSPKRHRDSYRVAKYLQERGYRIIPVYPRENEILGEKVYAQLDDIPVTVDIINVFRRSDQVPPVIESAVRLQPAAVWLQLGVISEDAAVLACGKGLLLIMDRCIMIEHRRLGL
ncbi:MAG: CoA-binding protein [Bacillota bacterium]|nr:CoA-binding protein [Bacillota bacterium]